MKTVADQFAKTWRCGLEAALAKWPDEVVPYKLLPDGVDSHSAVELH